MVAIAYNQFENIYPLKDGNGRVGRRLLLNNVLLKHYLPLMNIEMRNRSQYYAALQAYENDHNTSPILGLMRKEYKALKKTFRQR